MNGALAYFLALFIVVLVAVERRDERRRRLARVRRYRAWLHRARRLREQLAREARGSDYDRRIQADR